MRTDCACAGQFFEIARRRKGHRFVVSIILFSFFILTGAIMSSSREKLKFRLKSAENYKDLEGV